MAKWRKVKLADVCKFVRGPFGGSLKKDIFVSQGYAVFEQQHAIYGDFNKFRYFVTKDKFNEMQRFKLSPGDLIMSCSGTLGKVALVPEGIPNGIINQALLKLTPTDEVEGSYIKSWFESDLFTQSLRQNSGGAAIQNVAEVRLLKEIEIPLPPLAEQRKIAEILRTWDEATETAEAELKAKQERKRWLMDKLLRLGAAGFSKLSASGWTVQKLGDILEIRHGKNQREVETPEGSYPILGTGGIIGRTNAYLYDKPSVLIGRKGTIDRPQYMDTPFWTIDTLFYTSISDCALPRFIFYVFCTINWQQYNAATGVPSLAASTIESIEIQLPPLAEQRKIADILQAVDADMEVINCRIETLRSQKRGLMQKLLTGEVRVAA